MPRNKSELELARPFPEFSNAYHERARQWAILRVLERQGNDPKEIDLAHERWRAAYVRWATDRPSGLAEVNGRRNFDTLCEYYSAQFRAQQNAQK